MPIDDTEHTGACAASNAATAFSQHQRHWCNLPEASTKAFAAWSVTISRGVNLAACSNATEICSPNRYGCNVGPYKISCARLGFTGEVQ